MHRKQQAPADRGFSPGDLIVGVVRHQRPAGAAISWRKPLERLQEALEHGSGEIKVIIDIAS